MRILRVIESVDPVDGGPIEGLKRVSAVLVERGNQVEVASCDDPGAPFVEKFEFPLHTFGPSSGTFGYSTTLGPWLEEHVSEFDAVVIHALWQYKEIVTRAACRRARVPYFVFTHGMLDPWFNRAYRAKYIKKLLFWPLEYRVLRDAEGVLFTSREECRLARKSFWPYRARERVISYGAVRPPSNGEGRLSQAFLSEYPELSGKRILLFLGRIHPKKGCDLLLRAFANIATEQPDLRLVFAGPDSDGYQEELEKIAQSKGVQDRVIWTGMLSGDQKYGAFYASDAFVLPSHQENFGIAVAEALSCGAPVLISRQVNIWQEIVEAGAGLAEDDTQEGTNQLLRQWVELSQEKRARMREAALPCFEGRFTVERSADDLLALIESAKRG